MVNETELLIAEARRLLRPTPVRLGHTPRWLSTCIRKFVGSGVPNNCHCLFDAVYAKLPSQPVSYGHSATSWLDHWGTTYIHDVQVFVSEPYLYTPDVLHVSRIAEAIGLEFHISPNAWWYPGFTTRLILARPSVPESPETR